MRVRAVLALTTFVLLAGCTQAPVPDAAPEPTPGAVLLVDPESGQTRTVRAWNTTFPGVHTMGNDTYDGSFDAGEHWTGSGELLNEAGVDAGSFHVRDITDLVPKGVPVQISAEVNADLAHGDLDLWFNLPAEAIWTSTYDTPFGGYSAVGHTVVLAATDTVEVVVFYDEPEPSPSVEYRLDVAVHSMPDVVPPGVATVVPVPRGAASLEVAFFQGGGSFLLWGPDDTFLGRMTGDNRTLNHTLTSRGGDHVLLIPQDAPGARLRVYAEGEPPRAGLELRPTKQDIQRAAVEPFTPNTPASVTFDTPRMPIQAGLEILIDDFMDVAEGGFDGPTGNLFTFEIDDDLPFVKTNPNGPFGFMMLTNMGDEGLAAGTYTGRLDSDMHGNGELALWLVHFVRA